MNILVFDSKLSLGQHAAGHAAAALRNAVRARGVARFIAATGASQFEFLEALTALPGIPWQQTELFHLDEYIGLPSSHPASFRKYLLERLINKAGITNYHFLDGEADPGEAIRRVSAEITSAPVDVAFVGIGENGHLAFNDPPADFQTQEPFLIVQLDDACRRQQVGEGWFRDVSVVPRQAISMSVQQILKAREILVVVPDARKAKAVKDTCEGEITPMVPASILRTHANVTLYFDKHSAQFLSMKTKAQA